jgi:hypothetical protein
MDRRQTVQECDQRIQELVPEVPRPEQKAMAQLVCGVLYAESSHLSRASAATPGEAQDRSKQRRAQRLLANERLDVARAGRRLMAQVLRGRRGRIDLLLDATTNGETKRGAETVTLCLALRWHGRALPLVWQTWRADQEGQHWAWAIPRLLDAVVEHVPSEANVVLLADRGLSNHTLARAARDRGWHYLLRVQRCTRVRLPDGTVREIGTLVPRPTPSRAAHAWHRQGCITDAAIGHGRRKQGSRWVTDWDVALTTNVVALPAPTPGDDPWLLITDLPASPARCREYRHRTDEEELFRDLKSFGWQWQDSRLHHPDRVDRLLLILTLATLWIFALTQYVLRHDLRHLLEDRSRRSLSFFQLGLHWLRRCLATDHDLRCSFVLPLKSAPLKLS